MDNIITLISPTLLLIEIQSDIINDSTEYSPLNQAEYFININTILQKFRSCNYNVVHIHHTQNNTDTTSSTVYPAAKPLSADIIMTRVCTDSIHINQLHQQLISLSSQQLVILGVNINHAINHTCGVLAEYNYDMMVVSDAVVNVSSESHVDTLKSNGTIKYKSINTTQLIASINAVTSTRHKYTLQQPSLHALPNPSSNNSSSTSPTPTNQLNTINNNNNTINNTIPSLLSNTTVSYDATTANVPVDSTHTVLLSNGTAAPIYHTAAEFLSTTNALCAHHPLCCIDINKCNSARYVGNYDQRASHNVSIRKHPGCTTNELCEYSRSTEPDWDELRIKYTNIHNRHKVNDSLARKKRRHTIKQQKAQSKLSDQSDTTSTNDNTTSSTTAITVPTLPELPTLISKSDTTTPHNDSRKANRSTLSSTPQSVTAAAALVNDIPKLESSHTP